MPRLSSSLLRHAASRNRHLPRLLLECRDLSSAENELRWLTQFAYGDTAISRCLGQKSPQGRLTSYVYRRSKGEPLQYILGTQPFGDLEILCRPGVLIPRPETETYTVQLAELIIAAQRSGHLHAGKSLAVADLCTGTGCIALLLQSLLMRAPAGQPHKPSIKEVARSQILGADISPVATALAEENLKHNLRTQLLPESAKDSLKFCQLDVLALGREAGRRVQSGVLPDKPLQTPSGSCRSEEFLDQSWPIIVSNPPYIDPCDYAPGGTTTRSVREYEPKLALVPPKPAMQAETYMQTTDNIQRADVFYQALLYIAKSTETELLLMEIGDTKQACRVIALAQRILMDPESGSGSRRKPIVVEIWKDNGAVESWELNEHINQQFAGSAGGASARAVVIWRGAVAVWRQNRIRGQMSSA